MTQRVKVIAEEGRFYVVGERNDRIMLEVTSRPEAVRYAEGWNDAIEWSEEFHD